MSRQLLVKTMTIGYFKNFLENARTEDIKEATIAGDLPFLQQPLTEIADAYALVDNDDNVYAIGGVYAGNRNYVWMLCTNMVETNTLKFMWNIRRIYSDFLKEYGRMENIVWLDNVKHVRWLKALQAKWGETLVVNGYKFQHFWFEKG